MKIMFNLAGSQYCDFDDKEHEYVGKAVTLVHDPDIKGYPLALSVRTEDDVHVGYVPEDGRRFTAHQGLYESVVFGFEVFGVITEALYKTPAGRFSHLNIERVEKGQVERFAKGEFIVFQIELTVEAGDDSASYENDGDSYLRLTRILDMFKWDPTDEGLMGWAVNSFKSYDDYNTYVNGCAVDGQLIHHKAELALYKQDLPEEVAPVPSNLVAMIKRVKKVHGTEEKAWDKDIRVAGTYDACVEVEGLECYDLNGDPVTISGKAIFDWKRSRRMSPKYVRQVAFYAKNTGCDYAVLGLARARGIEKGEPGIVCLNTDDIEKYYKQLSALAKFIWDAGLDNL